MTPEQAKSVRKGEIIVGHGLNTSLENHVRSGFKVTDILPQGLQVRRVHMTYLKHSEQPDTPAPIESWTIRWDQLGNMSQLPDGVQLPLF